MLRILIESTRTSYYSTQFAGTFEKFFSDQSHRMLEALGFCVVSNRKYCMMF